MIQAISSGIPTSLTISLGGLSPLIDARDILCHAWSASLVNILAKDAVSFPTPTFGNTVFFPTFSCALAHEAKNSENWEKFGKNREK